MGANWAGGGGGGGTRGGETIKRGGKLKLSLLSISQDLSPASLSKWGWGQENDNSGGWGGLGGIILSDPCYQTEVCFRCQEPPPKMTLWPYKGIMKVMMRWKVTLAKSEVFGALAAVRRGSCWDNTSIQITWRLLTWSGIFTGTPDSSDTWKFLQFLPHPCVSASEGCKYVLNYEAYLAVTVHIIWLQIPLMCITDALFSTVVLTLMISSMLQCKCKVNIWKFQLKYWLNAIYHKCL